jgi:murein DD-endopeptidase MepM/ murein hydrolase activator NlpD
MERRVLRRSVSAVLIAGTGLGAPALAEGASADTAAPVQIVISRTPEIVGEGAGRAMYAARDGFSDSAAIVSFSSTRPRRTRSLGAATPVAAAASAYAAPAGPRRMPAYFPLSARMSSGFGQRVHPISGQVRSHAGVDLAAGAGTPVSATAGGVVAFANWGGGYGNLVTVVHAGGVETRYGHLMRMAVAPGQQVRTGDVIGWVGSTGLSTGPHLHYEVRIGGRAVSPFSR